MVTDAEMARAVLGELHTDEVWTERLGVPVRVTIAPESGPGAVVVLVRTDVPTSEAVYVYAEVDLNAPVLLGEFAAVEERLEREWRKTYPVVA